MASRRRPAKRTANESVREGKGWAIFDWAVVIIFALMALIGAISALVPPESGDREQENIPVSGSAIVIQVFNGTGDADVISFVTDSLRRQGFDVRDFGKNTDYIYPQSLILDRKGNEIAIDTLMEITGLTRDRVVLQRNEDIYELTLVIGKDYKTALAKLVAPKIAN